MILVYYAKKEKVFFWQTSALDSRGIDDLFDDIGKNYLSPEFNNGKKQEFKDRYRQTIA